MPPFQYRPVDYSGGQQIPGLMMAGGQIQAQGLQQAAAARAQGMIGAGQAWGQGLQNLGNLVLNVPQMMQQRQEFQLKSQMQQMQLAQMQREAKSQAALQTAFMDPANRDETTGKIDWSKMEDAVGKSGNFNGALQLRLTW